MEISLNAAGLSNLGRMTVSVLDERFNPLPGVGAAECTGPMSAGLRQKATWRGGDQVAADGPIRVRVDFSGIRPEDLRLYAIYVAPPPR